MARKPRIHFPGAFYHVIARGNGGQEIFRDDQDYELYLKFLREYKARFHFLIYASFIRSERDAPFKANANSTVSLHPQFQYEIQKMGVLISRPVQGHFM